MIPSTNSFAFYRMRAVALALLVVGLLSPLATTSRTLENDPEIAELRNRLDGMFNLPDERAKGSTGLLVVSLRTGRTWIDINSSKALTPASTTKLLTSYAALVLFGADYRVPTMLYGSSEIDASGRLDGDLYIKGHGDPLFDIHDVDRLVEKIARLGLKEVTGNVVGDGTYFDATTERMEYSGDADHVVDLPPIAGLGIGDNVVTIVASAPRTSGKPVRVQTTPPSSGFRIVNSAKSVAGRSTNNLSISIEIDDAGDQVVRVSGTLGTNRSKSRRFEVADPARLVAGMIYDRLESRGIQVGGKVSGGGTPTTAVELTSTSRPLGEIIDPVMKRSHNFYAEHLFKMIGGATGTTPTAAASRSSIIQCLTACSAPTSSLKLNDGSGLSRRNLISPETLVAVLEAARHNPLLFDALYSSMSIAGVDGTLRKRMRGTKAADNLRGKTGTLRNVSSLCGYVTTADGEPLAFAMIMNGYSIGAYKSVQNTIGAELAAFRRSAGGTM